MVRQVAMNYKRLLIIDGAIITHYDGKASHHKGQTSYCRQPYGISLRLYGKSP